MNNIICIDTRQPYAPPPAVTFHSDIKPGSRLILNGGESGWIVFKICYEGGNLVGYEVSRHGRRAFLRIEQVAGVMQ